MRILVTNTADSMDELFTTRQTGLEIRLPNPSCKSDRCTADKNPTPARAMRLVRIIRRTPGHKPRDTGANQVAASSARSGLRMLTVFQCQRPQQNSQSSIVNVSIIVTTSSSTSFITGRTGRGGSRSIGRSSCRRVGWSWQK